MKNAFIILLLKLFNSCYIVLVCGKPVEGKDDPFTGAKIDPNFKYPWIATLYRQINDELEYICGGNLISDSLILTGR